MKPKFFIVTFLLFSTVNAVIAQQNVSFWKKSGIEVTTRDSCDFIRIISLPDSGTKLFNIKEYYKNGKIKLAGKTSRTAMPQLENQCITFYPNGKKESIITYNKGHVEGDYYAFFPNGKLYYQKEFDPAGSKTVGPKDFNYKIVICCDSTGNPLVTNGNGHYVGYGEDFKDVEEEGEVKDGLRDGEWKGHWYRKTMENLTALDVTFTETYQNGKLLKGESIATDGSVANYTIRQDEPYFKGGEEGFDRFLSTTVRYPEAARRSGITGRVYLSFVIEKDGTVSNFKVVRNPDDQLTAAALSALKTSPQWTPGKLFGRLVRVFYTVPVAFTMAGFGF